jgi:hypothetical protein
MASPIKFLLYVPSNGRKEWVKAAHFLYEHFKIIILASLELAAAFRIVM